jgi:hypothetical protein
VDRGLGRVQVLDERDDAARVVELVLPAAALILDPDAQAAVQEGELAQALREDLEAEVGRREDQRIRLEGDLGAAVVRGAEALQRSLGLAATVTLEVDVAIAPDLQLRTCRRRGAWS